MDAFALLPRVRRQVLIGPAYGRETLKFTPGLITFSGLFQLAYPLRSLSHASPFRSQTVTVSHDGLISYLQQSIVTGTM